MKKKSLFLISFLIIIIIPVGLLSQPIIIDHTCTALDQVPDEWINLAKSELRFWYGHTSHGSQITSGMNNLESHYGEPYTYNSSGAGGALSYQETGGDLGHNGDTAWAQSTRNKLNQAGCDRNVVMWSWCGGCSDNTEEGINIYLNKMTELENDYPDVKFIYMTGHLDIWSWENLKARNQQIRDYCIANDKILFDFADIESYNPDGDYFEYASDNCNYYSGPGGSYLGNWANEWCAANPGSDLCWDCSCAHSRPLNCNLKGRAFWWMVAEMVGWGQEQTIFYVDNGHPEASDDNPGTIDLPWLTIQHAVDVAQAGDSVLVREGIYQESVSTQNDGSASEGYIVFAAYPGENAVIDGTDVGPSTGLYLSNAYIKLYGFEITNWPSTGIWAQDASFFEMHGLEVHEMFFGIGISGSSHDFLLSETEVHHFTLYGIDASPMLDDFCYNGTFINCTAHTCRDPEQNVDGFALGHGIQNNFLLQGCTTYDVFDGFDISSTSVLLDRCLAYNCLNSCYKLWEDDVEMVNCIGYNGGISIVQVCWQDFPAETTLRNCTFYDAEVYTIWVGNSNDILNMYNCIISGGENIGLCFEQNSAENYHGDFNLFQNNNPSRTISIGYETEFSTTQIENGEWALYSGQDENSVTAETPDEIFSNAAAYDLHLTALSPAVNNGSMDWAPNIDFDGNTRPFGSAPDIGAYESQNLLSYSVDPMNINFGTVFIGESQTEQITITNNSGTPIIFDSVEVQPEVFELSEITFPLEVGDSFSFDVTFEPGAEQSYSGSVDIFSSQTYNTEVTLSGTGANEPSEGYHVSGEVSGIWDIYDTIYVDGDIIVPDGQTLTVNPVPGGTDFIFTGHYRFLVYGQLELMGTQQDSIHLWSMGSEDGWLGLRFFDIDYNGMDSSRVRFCSFKHGNAFGDGWEDENGGALFLYLSSNVVIEDCYIHNNEATDGGGGIQIRYCSPIIKRCVIRNNSASFGGGVHFWGSYSDIQTCIICQNTATVEGGAININGGGPFFDHCTVSENSSPLGDGVFIMDWPSPEFTNSIIWGNNETDVYVSGGSEAAFTYCDIGGEGIYSGTGNINEDPLFADAENGDFSLTWANYPIIDETKSPCIDSGNPLSPPDPDGSITDMGAILFEIENNHIPGGDISGTWQNFDTIFIDGDINVPLGETFEIIPANGGTFVIFTGYYKINVYGRILFQGNTNDSIHFNSTGQVEGWHGIRFYSLDDQRPEKSVVSYCSFTNGNASGDWYDASGGALMFYESSGVILNNCLFSGNSAERGGAISLINSHPEISFVNIDNNTAEYGGGIYIHGNVLFPPPAQKRLLYSNNLNYLGAFRLPEGSNGSSWEWGGTAATYYPDGDPNGPSDGFPGSIYAVGHDWYFDISEISIPVPVISPDKNVNDLNTASTLQPFTNVTGGVFDSIAYEIIRIGLEYLPAQGQQASDKIYLCIGQHNQFEQVDVSHVWLETSLSNPQMAGPWYFDNIANFRTNDYMFSIPYSWADEHVFGQKLVCGRFRDGGLSGKGPNLFSFAPWTEGNPPPPDYHLQNITPLLMYNDNDSLSEYKHADEWIGGAWLTFGEYSSVILLGTKALGNCWYGFADGTLWPNDSNYIPPYPFDDRGWWADEFVPQIMFYDPDDFDSVANGIMLPSEPQPYDTLNIDTFMFNGQSDFGLYQVGSCCYDRENGIFYVIERRCDEDKSLIHAWAIDTTSVAENLTLKENNVELLSDLIITNNHATTEGGGIYIINDNPKIENVSLTWNTAGFRGGGIGMYYDANPQLSDFLVAYNQADWGGGIFFYDNDSCPQLNNFTVVNNHANASGGGMACDYGNPYVNNSIFWNNVADYNGNQVYLHVSNADPYFDFCDIEGGFEEFGGTGSGANYDTTRYTNNINAVPEFIVPASDFQLQDISPCVNTGNTDTSGMFLPATDLSGNPRIFALVIDMGTYENQAFVPNEQVLYLQAGWSGISSFINPYFPPVELLFEPIINELIILQNTYQVYWPAQNINTIGNWVSDHGYIIKVDQNVEVNFTGNLVENGSLELCGGWNLIPVLSTCTVSTDELQNQLGENLIFIKEVAGWKIFWPSAVVNTLEELTPGKSYFMKVDEECTFDFPSCTK